MDSDRESVHDYSSCYSLSERSDSDENALSVLTYAPNRNIGTIAPGNEVDPRTLSVPPVANGEANLGVGKNLQRSKVPPALVMDLVENIKGMYRLLDLFSESSGSGSDGGVKKVIIAQDSLKGFINAVCPGAHASGTKIDFKALNTFMIKPLGVYGSKVEIVRLLRSLNVVNESTAHLLLAPTEPGSSQPALSSGLYALAAGQVYRNEERHYVIYWPEDSTWNDLATSPVCQNRVTFMRYLTRICQQVVALLSAEHSASLLWSEEDRNTGSVMSRPGFQMNLRHIPRYMAPPRCSVDSSTFVPRLLHGETAQGFWTVTYVHQYIRSRPLDQSPHTVLSLNHLLNEDSLLLSEDLDEDAIQILVDVALSDIFPEQCNEWNVAMMDTRQRFRQELTEKQDKVFRDLERQEASLNRALRDEVVGDVIKLFPSIERDALVSRARADGDSDVDQEITQLTRVYDLRQGYHGFNDIYQHHVQNAKFHAVKGPEFRSLKERLISVCHLLKKHPDLSPGKRTALIQAFLAEDDLRRARQVLPGKSSWSSFSFSKIMGLLSGSKGVDERSLRKELKRITSDISDCDFLLQINDVDDKDLVAPIQRVVDLACTQLSYSIDAAVMKMSQAVLRMQQDQCRGSIQRDIEAEETDVLRGMLLKFIRDVNKISSGREASSVVLIQGVQRLLRKDHSSYEYHVTGRRDDLQEPKLKFRVYLTDLTSDDKQIMKFNPIHLPKPVISDQRSGNFYLPLGIRVVFHKLLENERLLLVLADQEKYSIYLERLSEMDPALQRGKPSKALNRQELGEDILFAYDEMKRMLSVCASTKMQLYAFVFDESFRSLQGQGGPIILAPLYSEADISIRQMSSVCGSDEVALVDSNAHIRVFSFVSRQFKPSSLELPSPPSAIYPSPDGSCLLVLHAEDPQPLLTAYHWDTFGATGGIPLAVPNFPLDGAVLTSMLSRGRAFLLALDINTQCVNSVAIDFVGKVPEVVLQDKGRGNGSNQDSRTAKHNILLDCYKEVWAQFPVIPAVKSRTSTSSIERQPRSLTFITENPTQPFTSHFSNLIQGFVRATKKPTGNELRGIKVSATDFESFRSETVLDPSWNITRYHVGEWLVDLLCLVPIHIAVCRENRFVPLANGVLSPELERSLLGADVNQIVDHLSFGWYESIFKSYMAEKPVKVVSSMGQQSVGKSFALNHLVDTSFASSAVRATEGVWLSVTPTDNELIVALDFEGLDSMERSPQEEALLVLFSTAISNLVLFRNDFATSRDISGLFKPFQSGATIMDPAINPSLFQSKLVVIVKDVARSDEFEIARDFSLKFQEIVEQERDANFISRLHGGKLDIIPWPVIESKEFYKSFAALKTELDQQTSSHSTAREFLYTIKTLMAKLKANDWGSLSQTMAEHRSKSLSALLPIALATGFSEINLEHQPLKDLDTDLIVEGHETEPIFTISSNGKSIPPARIEEQLFALTNSWTPSIPRQFMPDSELVAELRTHLNVLIDSRVNNTRFWLDCNLASFQGEHAAIDDLRRNFDNIVVDMRTNVQVCGVQCASCNLLCLRSRLHEGDHSCTTDHRCAHNCEFCEDELKPCGTRAGHSGKHTCVVAAHLCGEPCEMSGRRGCLEDCTKVAGHQDDHVCSAQVHMCGEPCDLKGMRLPDGTTYFCPERCTIPSDRVHETHSCDAGLCPSTCELCERRCGEQHLHGLTRGAHHMCREAHPCEEKCSYKGICEIGPQSIEATFIGRHGKFQYTKRTQVAKRLPCIKMIPPGQMSHGGRHSHSKKNKPFHYCEVQCGNCGYFCTLRLGHSEKDHETSHGSMTQTRWAVDGPEGTSLELEGRKFSSNDEGAPMMCSFVCGSMGRHVHITNCRSTDGDHCYGADIEHIHERLSPNPDMSKDAITHRLYWSRMGFKDPYKRDEQINFAKCDAMCAGPEHSGTPGTGQPSYCTLPMFHPLRNPDGAVNGPGYISNDGHLFECKNPVVQQAFHVIFVVDRSGSMGSNDLVPEAGAQMTDAIIQSAYNRLGAVYSALYSFWSARHAATLGRQTVGARRDAYSVILFDSVTADILTNDFTSTPDQLLGAVLGHQAGGGTNFSEALRAGGAVMEQNWSTERTPVMIFLSDGECSVSDAAIQNLCLSAVRLGKPLSFHSISFGPDASASYLRRMADLALIIQNSVPHNPETPASAPSSFSAALDTVQLTSTFSGIAESLRKPRGSLMS